MSLTVDKDAIPVLQDISRSLTRLVSLLENTLLSDETVPAFKQSAPESVSVIESSAPAKAAPAPAPAPVKTEVSASAPAVTVEELKQICVEACKRNAGAKDAIRRLLTEKYGVKNIQSLKTSDLSAVKKEIEAL